LPGDGLLPHRFPQLIALIDPCGQQHKNVKVELLANLVLKATKCFLVPLARGLPRLLDLTLASVEYFSHAADFCESISLLSKV